MSREKFAGEVTYINTDEWRAALGVWLDKEGSGAQERLKEQLGVNHGTISKLRSGKLKKSTLIGPISRLANIALPRKLTDEVTQVNAALQDIKKTDPLAYESFRNLIFDHHKRLKPR